MAAPMRSWVALQVACAALSLTAFGCAPLPGDDCGSQHNCPLEASSPADGSGPDVSAETSDSDAADAGDAREASSGFDSSESSTCDGAKAPNDDPCVIDERYGVFVSPLGADTSTGTRAAPVLTIGRGMDLAKIAGKRVYVCAGSFLEQLVVGASRDGVNVYGGLDCGTWTYNTANRVTLAPAHTGYALMLDTLVRGATFEDVEFDAQRANLANAGESSVAVFVSGSANVAFHRVVMAAGNATDGAAGAGAGSDGGPGSGPSNWYGTPPGFAELNGNDATDAGAGGQKLCMCPDGTSSTGGQGGGPAGVGQIPRPGLPSYGSDAGEGTPGMNGAQCARGVGLSGADAPGSLAASASTSWGSVSSGRWVPAVGANGPNGKVGQGGGGGGDGPAGVGGGGSGACGGCGGAGGRGGLGGGSSIALLSYQSVIALVGCTLTASNAGAGGPGGGGEGGQAGSLVGGNQLGSGCQGGGGGSGAGGNGGQGGPGGLSLGIGYVGTPPVFDAGPVAPGQALARVTVGASGAGGSKGLGGRAAATSVGQPQPGSDGPSGVAGVAQAVLGL
jgi:hypothetical protein